MWENGAKSSLTFSLTTTNHNFQMDYKRTLVKLQKKAKYVAAFVFVFFKQKPLHNIAYTPESRTYL